MVNLLAGTSFLCFCLFLYFRFLAFHASFPFSPSVQLGRRTDQHTSRSSSPFAFFPARKLYHKTGLKHSPPRLIIAINTALPRQKCVINASGPLFRPKRVLSASRPGGGAFFPPRAFPRFFPKRRPRSVSLTMSRRADKMGLSSAEGIAIV